METKDYAKMFRNIKDEILNEIRSLVPVNTAISFGKKFVVRYGYNECALVEYFKGIDVSADGSITFHVQDENGIESDPLNGEAIYQYDDDSFVAILSHLKKEIREKKLSHLREIVKQNGGRIEFDGNFTTRLSIDGEEFSVGVDSLYFDEDDCFCFENHHHKCYNSDLCDNLLSDELDNLIAYVERHSKRKFVVRVSGSYSRTFEIEAANFEEALEFAKTEWKEDAPLCPEDVNGEDWEDYTSVAH